MKQVAMIIFLFIAVSLSGCIWIDDDDDNYHPSNYEETIIYINRTGYSIENFIDGEFTGTVTPNTELRVYGYDYDGTHEYYSQCVGCSLEWGPTYFYVNDGETYRIYLEMAGMSFESAREEPDQSPTF